MRCIILLLALPMLGAEKPADPVPDKLRVEIVTIQRDLLLAKAEYDADIARRTSALKIKTSEAQALCEKSGKVFSDILLVCVDKPKPPPVKPQPEKP